MNISRLARSAVIAAVMAAVMAASAVTASAAQRYAAPGGTGPAASCPQNDPCDLDTAVEAPEVNDDDEVIVTPGTYAIASLQVTDAIDLHGQALQPRPTINASGSPGIDITDAATVRDLQVEAASFEALRLSASGVIVERVSGHSTGGGGAACSVFQSVTIRDSLCWNSGTNSSGVGANLSTFAGTYTARLRNVTAVGTSYGLGFDYSGTGVDFNIDAKNVIADGGSSPFADIRAGASFGASTQVTLASSNYATEFETTGSGGISATVTDPGTATNQTAPPSFVNAGAGDFHQQAGSPTIDAGVLDGFTGTGDFDGDARSLEGDGVCPTAPDIGADELIGSGPIDCDPPETTIAGGPTGTTADPTPTFNLQSDEPNSTFECKIDAGSFTACSTPYTTSSLADGNHTLEVRATDQPGNTDPTPASRTFSVDTTPPETTITDAPKRKVKTKRKRARVTLAFTADESGRFECSLDDKSFKPCSSPLSRKVRRGRHTWSVRAVDEVGNADPTPDRARFRVKRKRPRA
ncbi:MAG TPA: Ig-like domain-containing protein [Solirubrobacterales bacterium]|nr:Ig-like domain-containing protein [Solirubrobacterales bacterium]